MRGRGRGRCVGGGGGEAEIKATVQGLLRVHRQNRSPASATKRLFFISHTRNQIVALLPLLVPQSKQTQDNEEQKCWTPNTSHHWFPSPRVQPPSTAPDVILRRLVRQHLPRSPRHPRSFPAPWTQNKTQNDREPTTAAPLHTRRNSRPPISPRLAPCGSNPVENQRAPFFEAFDS